LKKAILNIQIILLILSLAFFTSCNGQEEAISQKEKQPINKSFFINPTFNQLDNTSQIAEYVV